MPNRGHLQPIHARPDLTRPALAAARAQPLAGAAGPAPLSANVTGATQRWRAYVALCKPRVVALVVFTALVSMCVALPEQPAGILPLWPTLIAGTLGVTLAAAAAALLTQVADRDLDALMRRTRGRPLPTHAVGVPAALALAAVLGTAAMVVLVLWVNTATALLALFALIGYAVVYTRWLKWSTPQNIVLGGAAGAAPALLGWTAITGGIDAEALSLFLIVFVWTPAHFWPLAIARRSDYAAAGVPMLPLTHGIAHTRGRILAYAVALLPVSLMPCVAGTSGALYALGALVLGTDFIRRAAAFARRGGDPAALLLFRFSITYLTALFALLLLDAALGVPGLPVPR